MFLIVFSIVEGTKAQQDRKVIYNEQKRVFLFSIRSMEFCSTQNINVQYILNKLSETDNSTLFMICIADKPGEKSLPYNKVSFYG